MQLNYSAIQFDKYGRPEPPVFLLETLDGNPIGTLSNVSERSLTVKFAEPSELKFHISAYNNGQRTPYYDDLSGFKLIRTKDYGIFVVKNPSETGDGIEAYKEVTAYSIEKLLENKRFFIEEGTFNFWNPVTPDDTILGRILEIASGWSVGYVSPSLIGKYRTFDSYDDYLLSFMYSSAPEKYNCVFVFDPYKKEFSVYDAEEQRPVLPIYLDFDNLIEELEVEELTDELVTALRPYGSDDLDIRSVNPIGSNYLYNLDYFIENGDINSRLAEKWRQWEAEIASNREYYRGLVGLQASVTAQVLAEQAHLTDLNGELEDLTNQQSITIQALANEITDEGKQQQQKLLDEINQKISAKKDEISDQEQKISILNEKIDGDNPDSYTSEINKIVAALSPTAYFSADEYNTLQNYFIEQDITEETFVSSDLSSDFTGETYQIDGSSVSISGSDVLKIDLEDQFQKDIYTLSGGSISISGDFTLTADIVRGTFESNSSGSFILSIYAGTVRSGDSVAQSGLITVSGNLSNLTTDVVEITENEISQFQGTFVSFLIGSGSLYLTVNAGEYQKYSVQMELFEYAQGVLNEIATPTYEFSVDTGNFIFSKEFSQFRNNLKLGDSLYLKLHDGQVITPVLIEIELDFEEREKLSLTFSNRFKRHDPVNTLKDMIENSYSTSRDFDASKYIYNQTVGTASKVNQFMSDSLDAAVNTIYGASNQSVRIDGAGIHIGGESDCQIRIVNSMIALSNDNWQTAKIGIGQFSSPDIGNYFGVNAEIVGGKLLVGNNLVIENPNDNGVMQFKVDSSGAWLYNSTFVMSKDSGGKLILDPEYGFVAGTGNLFSVDGTTVRPSFVDENGDIILDDKGMPQDANFYIDSRTGNAYFRGKIYATDGIFNGTVYAKDGEFTGTIHAKDGDFTGTVHATDGEFSGKIKAAVISGTITADAQTGGAIEGVSLNIGNGAFTVDSSGRVVIKNGSISWSAVTGTDEIDDKIESATNAAANAQDTANNAYDTANNAYSIAAGNGTLIERLADGRYSGGTFINGTTISAPYINGGQIKGIDIYGATFRNMDGTSYIKMNDSHYGQLDFYSSSTHGSPIFSIVDNIGSIELQAFQEAFLTHSDGGGTTANGDWNFSGNVTGITATFG